MHTNHEDDVRSARTIMPATGGHETEEAPARPAVAARAWRWIVGCYRRARRRARLRRDLARLDDHLLRDIGCRREDLLREVRRPFWRA